MENGTCSIEDCSRKAFCRGWCRSHYRIWQENGDPLSRDLLCFRDPSEAFAARTDHACHVTACCNVGHLRLATRAQNNRNLSGPKRNNKLGIRNVYQDSFGRCVVDVGGTTIGRYPSLTEAAQAAKRARSEKFGAFAGRG